MTRAPSWLMRRFWDAHSRGWDQVASGSEAESRRRDLADAVCTMAPEGGRVVDLGCGAGHLATELAQRGLRVTGADFSSGMLARARRRAGELGVSVEWEQVDLNATFPWQPSSFDAVVSSYVLQVVGDPVTFLIQAGALVEREGAIVVEVPCRASERSSLPHMRSRDRVLNEIKRATSRLPGGVVWYGEEDLREVAEAAGLAVSALSSKGPACRLVARRGQ